MGGMEGPAGRALLFFGVDLDFPVVLAGSRRGGNPGDWSRPGLRIARAPLLASWEKGTGRLWIGLGRRGVAGVLWGEPPPGEVLLPALEAAGLEEGVDACRRAFSGGGVFRGGVVLASREGAWMCRPGEAGRVLEPGGHLFPPGEGEPPPREEGKGALEAARDWLVREEGTGPAPPARAAALLALGEEEIPAGKFLFLPGTPGERPFLDYSNLLARLCGPTV